MSSLWADDPKVREAEEEYTRVLSLSSGSAQYALLLAARRADSTKIIWAPWNEEFPECLGDRTRHCLHHIEDGDPCCFCRKSFFDAIATADHLRSVRA